MSQRPNSKPTLLILGDTMQNGLNGACFQFMDADAQNRKINVRGIDVTDALQPHVDALGTGDISVENFIELAHQTFATARKTEFGKIEQFQKQVEAREEQETSGPLGRLSMRWRQSKKKDNQSLDSIVAAIETQRVIEWIAASTLDGKKIVCLDDRAALKSMVMFEVDPDNTLLVQKNTAGDAAAAAREALATTEANVGPWEKMRPYLQQGRSAVVLVDSARANALADLAQKDEVSAPILHLTMSEKEFRSGEFIHAMPALDRGDVYVFGTGVTFSLEKPSQLPASGPLPSSSKPKLPGT